MGVTVMDQMADIFRRKDVWIKRTTKKIFRLWPFLNPAATTPTKPKTEPRNVFPRKRKMSQHICEACSCPLPQNKTIQDSQWHWNLQCSVLSLLVCWRQFHSKIYVMLQCCAEYGVTSYSLLIWTQPAYLHSYYWWLRKCSGNH